VQEVGCEREHEAENTDEETADWEDSAVAVVNCRSCEVATDRLCGLVVGVSGCSARGPGLYSRYHKIFCVAVGLERGPLSFLRIDEELLEIKVAAPV
jgi:hypothetical protein